MRNADLYGVLARWADHKPQDAALLAPGEEAIRFGELVQRIDAVCEQLEEAALGPGDRVALLCPLGIPTAVLTLAVACRAPCVPLHPSLTAAELSAALTETRARALVYASDRAGLPCEVEDLEIPALRVAWDFPLEAGRGTSRRAGPSDLALLMRTSGSTGRPKLVPVTHEQLIARTERSARFLHLSDVDRCLNLMPLNFGHGVFTGLTTPLCAGGSVVCPRSVDEPTFFDCLESLQPTWYTASATHQLNVLAWLRNREATHRLRFARSGSSALPVSALEELERRLGVPVVEGLSSSETGTITSNPPTWERKPGTVGTARDDDVAVVDEQGHPVAPGQAGEVLARGPHTVLGYDRDPKLTSAKFRDGWFHTGDLAELDADGFLTLRGRLDEVINRGGEKISPLEVEAVLLSYPGVEEALAFAAPHRTLGAEVAAALVPAAGVRVDKAELRRYLSERLSPTRVPRRIFLAPKLPRTPSGKPQRRGAAEFFRLGPARAQETWRARASRALRKARRFVVRRLIPSRMTPFERSLLENWRRVLGRNVRVEDDFFDMGGDSLSAVTLIQAIREDLGVEISPQLFMEHPTPRSLARRLWASPPVLPDIIKIRTEGTGRPVFAVGGRFGLAFRLIVLGRALGRDRPFYGLIPPYLDWRRVGRSTIPEFAAYYVERIREVQPEGPYRLLGNSFGGLVVYEIALQLQAAGHPVELLALIDTYPATCRIDGRLDSDEKVAAIQLDDGLDPEGTYQLIARAHMRAREAYVMERRFEGELTYFLCRDHQPRNRDRRGLWESFAAKINVVPIPGDHGRYHIEPQFSALCSSLEEILHTLDQRR
jgi:acyl-CoA synthetase (AMP-forming)/AMP-acid ligase II/thioesterase domain-containing protein/acyl carrier protein